MKKIQARVHTLPILRLTTVSSTPGEGFLPVDHQINETKVKYWRQVKTGKALRRNTFLKFPIVLAADGSPWEPAFLWLTDRAQSHPSKVSSLGPIAQALRDYKVFLDDVGLEWDDFSSIEKLIRPTYLYLTHLEDLVSSGQIQPSTAKRRLSTVICLYRFARSDHRMMFSPANEPWNERQITLRYRDSMGFNRGAEIATTDLRIRRSSGTYALSDEVFDGGKLRPLTAAEQEALIRALQRLGNTEFSLMHFVGLLTGAREMTVLTLRLKDFLAAPSTIQSWPLKVRCGPGTGIDTKLDKTGVYLSFPQKLYEMLYVYCLSTRAINRRAKSRIGDNPMNYLFLTRQGNPYYEGKDERNEIVDGDKPLRRTSAQGQSLREFIRKRVIPTVRQSLPKFCYKFHDTRATFGMNWVDHVMGDEPANGQKYHWAMDQLRKLMWHKNIATTEKYLEYRINRQHLKSALQGWAEHLVRMIEDPPRGEREAPYRNNT